MVAHKTLLSAPVPIGIGIWGLGLGLDNYRVLSDKILEGSRQIGTVCCILRNSTRRSLTKECCDKLERVQKSALRVIFGSSYATIS